MRPGNSTSLNLVYTIGVEVELVLYVIQAVLAVYFILRLKNISLMHVNLRVILCNVPMIYLIFTPVRLYFIIEYLITYFTNGKLENSSFERCLVIRFFYDMAINVLAFTIPMLALERAIATLKSGRYETCEKPWLGFGIVAGMYCIGFAYSLVFVWYDYTHNYDAYSRMPSCHLMFTNPGVMFYLAVACCVGFGVAMTLLYGLYLFNLMKQKQHGRQNLAARYQYAENVATLRVLVPTVTGYLVSLVISMTLISLHYFQKEYLASSDWIFEQVFNLNIVVFVLYFMIMHLALYSPLRKQVSKDYERLFWRRRRTHETNPSSFVQQYDHEKTTNTYFKQLESVWN
ncbi:hypothetical protein QR680_016842 [Steinernema hermaphroditum]|uniref:G-protein coupled receptors family 1 profile domain-containing protein n=1 Tax=Steinernema hermaphroditum TaxID=289476 RepID=A0AA39LN32_9BILA|nr:hypothetical protein QR680_016842 [Steinernema hermaphroditum]